MPLSVAQVSAIQQAKEILMEAGLLDCNDFAQTHEGAQLQNILDLDLVSAPHPSVVDTQYLAPPATPFMPQEIATGANQLTRQAYVHAMVQHPPGAIVEYPETGIRLGEAVAHKFCLSAVKPSNNGHNFYPRANIQYLLGDKEGYHTKVTCHLLHCVETGELVACRQLKTNCESVLFSV